VRRDQNKGDPIPPSMLRGAIPRFLGLQSQSFRLGKNLLDDKKQLRVQRVRGNSQDFGKRGGQLSGHLERFSRERSLYSLGVQLLDIAGLRNKRDTGGMLSDDDLAHAVVLHISSSLHWRQETTIDWYAFAVNTRALPQESLTMPSADKPGRELIIQVIFAFVFSTTCHMSMLQLCYEHDVRLSVCNVGGL